MSKIELLAKIELLNKYEAMMEELKNEADTTRVSVPTASASGTQRKSTTQTALT